MKRMMSSFFLGSVLLTSLCLGQQTFQTDDLSAAGGNVRLTFLGHASLILTYNSRNIYVDPVSRYADFAQLPKADLILVTHEHGDHLDSVAIEMLRKETTVIMVTQPCARFVVGADVLGNGDTRTVEGVTILAVPAYNIVNMRSPGNPFHPKGSGNGYVLTIGGLKVYIAGDTENIPEMSNLGAIDCAFLPMNLPYTMTPAMVAEAAKRIKPRIFYPYHFGNTDTHKLLDLLSGQQDTEIRVRNMK
jgi:L-ascorbate metabolism protein UlaG (beta-lactamase superfamily)